MDREALTELFEYLDQLRESGETNMYGARAYIVRDLAWPTKEAGDGLSLWMKTFDPDKTMDTRVSDALETL